MNYKKTGFSYVLWGIYTLLICTLLTLGVLGITMDIGMTNMTYRILCVGIFFLLIFGFAALIYSLFGSFLRKKRWQGPDWTAIELILVTTVFLFILAFYVKAVLCSLVAENSVLVGDTRYYEMAILTDKSAEIPWMAHGASYIFTLMLRGMCLMFGNIDMSVVLLQTILQYISVIFAYFSVRNLFGRLAAFITPISIVLLPVFTQKLQSQTAEVFLFCVIQIVLFAFSLLLRLIHRGKMRKFAWSIVFVLYGILVAGCIYLDAVGLVILLVSVVGILTLTRSTTETDDDTKQPLIRNRAVQIIWIILGAVAGVACICGVRAYIMQMSYAQTFFEYVNIYVTNWQGFDGLTYFILDLKIVPNLVIYILAALSIAGFWFVKQDNSGMAVVYFAGTTVLQFVIHDGVAYDCISKYGIILLAVLSIQKMIDFRLQKYAMAESEEQEIKDEIVIENKTTEIQFIENPLPLPKKHVPKTMDYDIEVAEDDDYDII